MIAQRRVVARRQNRQNVLRMDALPLRLEKEDARSATTDRKVKQNRHEESVI
jgi:hypothetical protein